MVLITTGLFLTNLLCSLVPCFPTYPPPSLPNSPSRYSGNPDSDLLVSLPVPVPVPVKRGSGNNVSSERAGTGDWAPAPAPAPVVKTREGNVQGYLMETVSGRRIFAFDGIPYAEPPIGPLRFKEPMRRRSWSGVYAANSRTNANCIQIDLSTFYSITGREDCLYLNVYTPQVLQSTENEGTAKDLKPPKLLPVLVYFFGGAFFFGSKDQYGPSYLLDKDVLLVTLNYRLGVLGFLSTGDLVSPGNYGLKDQTMALEWVRDNIREFGGDPDQVTLIGQSAGAASVHLHMLSKKSRGLFRAGISQSGSAFNSWSILKTVPKTTLKFSRLLNCQSDSDNTMEMVDCLRTISAHALTGAQTRLFEWMNHPAINFAPVIEPPHASAFLTESPSSLYSRGDIARVPWITGFVPDEGNIYNILMMLNPLSYFSLNHNFLSLAPMTLSFRGLGLNETEVSEKIRQEYFGTHDISVRNLKSQSNMYGDRTLLTGIYRGMKEHSRWAPTYGYFFNYTGKFSILERTGMTREEAGVSHYDDIIYLFNSSAFHPSINVGDPDFRMVQFLVDVWTNFASTTVPTHTNSSGGDNIKFWEPLITNSNSLKMDLDGKRRWREKPQNESSLRILLINSTPQMIPFPSTFLKRIQFWETLNIPQ